MHVLKVGVPNVGFEPFTPQGESLGSEFPPVHGSPHWASLMAQRLKRLPAMRETWVWSLDREDPLEKEMATHSSILAWRIPWIEEPGGLQSMGSQRVGHNWTTSLSLSLSHCSGLYDENVSQPHLHTSMWFLLAWYVLITQSDFSFLFSFFKEIIVLCVVLDSVCLQEEESSVSSFIAILNWN